MPWPAVGRLDDAIAHYQAAARLNTNRIESFSGQGICYARQGKMEEAARQFRHVTELNPKDTAAYGNLGNALGSQGKFDQAIACYLTALQIDPGDYQAEFNLGSFPAPAQPPRRSQNPFPGRPAPPPGLPRRPAGPLRTGRPRQMSNPARPAARLILSNLIHRAGGWFGNALFKYAASEDTCISVSGPPSATANPGIVVCGLPRAMMFFQ